MKSFPKIYKNYLDKNYTVKDKILFNKQNQMVSWSILANELFTVFGINAFVIPRVILEWSGLDFSGLNVNHLCLLTIEESTIFFSFNQVKYEANVNHMNFYSTNLPISITYELTLEGNMYQIQDLKMDDIIRKHFNLIIFSSDKKLDCISCFVRSMSMIEDEKYELIIVANAVEMS